MRSSGLVCRACALPPMPRVAAWGPRLHLGNSLRSLATPDAIESRSLTSLSGSLIETGSGLVRKAAMPLSRWPRSPRQRKSFAGIVKLIDALRGPPDAVSAAAEQHDCSCMACPCRKDICA
jgi:hypothetical protein